MALVAGLVAAACSDGSEAPLRVLAEEGDLTRQVEDLQRLVERAQRGALVPTDGVVIAIGERLVREAVKLSLPREEVIEGRYRVRLDEAGVTLRDGHASVRLEGRVGWTVDTSTVEGEVFADLTVFARVEAIGADAEAGTLTARVSPYGFEIHRLRLGEEQPGTGRLIEALGRALPETLSAFATPLTLPVVLEERLRFPALKAGPVTADGASVALRVGVSDAFAQEGRLFVVLRIDAGPWTRDRR